MDGTDSCARIETASAQVVECRPEASQSTTKSLRGLWTSWHFPHVPRTDILANLSQNFIKPPRLHVRFHLAVPIVIRQIVDPVDQFGLLVGGQSLDRLL